MSIVKNGRLTVPLFHGTSSLFYESILSHGLGGRNILEDMGIRAAACLLVELAAPYCDREDVVGDFSAYECIAVNPENSRRSIFRYCGTYLSPSRDTAARYAFLYGKHGGEALTHVLKLYRTLANLLPGIARHNPQLVSLFEFATRPSKPLVIEAADVEIGFLQSENGGNIDQNLKEVESTIDDPIFYDFWLQQTNFELTRPIPASRLTFHEPTRIQEFDGEGGSREVLQLLPFPQISSPTMRVNSANLVE